MHVLVAVDKFTGTLTAREVAAAISGGLAAAGVPSTALPLADGGDGSVDAALTAGSRPEHLTVRGADPTDTTYAYDGHTAVVEVASTCGLATLPNRRRAPMTAGGYGFGEAVRAAADRGARRIVLALGGSASTDRGAGMFAALGVRFVDDAGRDITPTGGTLGSVCRVDVGGLIDLTGIDLIVATDVDNPLLHEHGAAAVFAPQKGADPWQVLRLEVGLDRLVHALADTPWSPGGASPTTLADDPGAAAAGGWASRADGWARHVSPAVTTWTCSSLDAHVSRSDAVITGEGCLDRQSLAGKLPSVVARRAAGRPSPTGRQHTLARSMSWTRLQHHAFARSQRSRGERNSQPLGTSGNTSSLPRAGAGSRRRVRCSWATRCVGAGSGKEDGRRRWRRSQ